MPRKPARKKKSYRSSKRGSSAKAKKRQTRLKQVFAVSVLFIVSATFLSGFFFYKKITQLFVSALSTNSKDILSEDLFTTAFIVVDDFESDPVLTRKVALYVFDKSTLKLIIYEIPVETMIDVPGRFSEEPFSNILALGSLHQKDLAECSRLLSDSIFKLLAFPVDRYILVESGGENFFRALFAGSFNLPNEREIRILKEMVKTDHDIRELFGIYRFTNSLPQDRIINKVVGETYLKSPNLIDEEFMDLTFDSELSREKKNIAVLNGTDKSGVAAFGARVIKNFGGRVVAVGNTRNIYEESLIITDDATSESTRMIAQIFNIERIILYSDAHNFPESEINRSDVTVIFGLDFAASL